MNAIPLTMLKPGMKGKIVAIHGGKGFVMRLYQMGFTPNTIVKVVSSNAGPVIVEVRNTTIALGRGMASKIMVEPI